MAARWIVAIVMVVQTVSCDEYTVEQDITPVVYE